ncbi:hypothetical protein A8C32_18020 [Flavivirga aquatica]|uniref:Uncharacterized protein n=1 Tax=Flavivirga aquatica TaxID=1849968 RepID=A0A1E5T7H4_9FLAO|nr:hypothetical protein A8C32_18020 [Flavivirga aquatica]
MSSYLLNYFLTTPFNRDKTNNTKNIKKHILAIPADAPATPPNPNTPAIIAMMINVIVQRNIFLIF